MRASLKAAVAAVALALTMAGVAAAGHTQDAAAVVPEAEENDVAVLPPMSPRWAFVTNWLRGGIRIVDGDTGKVIGMVHSATLSDFAFDPGGKFFYVAETIWTRGNRGQRQDLLTVYDARTLAIVSEIPIAGRLLIGSRPYNLSIAPDGKHAFIFNLDPSTSIQVVDLTKRRLIGSVEVPGCGLSIAGADTTTTSLCSNGSMATVVYDARMQGLPRRSDVFFSAENDPIFDNSAVDRRRGTAIFLTYSGMLYEARLGADPKVAEPWSVQVAAGAPKVTTQPLQVSWLPGGRQPIAFNRATGRAYILMHMGEFWSQKVSGTELWEVDIAHRQVLRRKPLSTPVASVSITQDAKPLLFLLDGDDKLKVMDVETLEVRHEITNAGNGVISTADN